MNKRYLTNREKDIIVLKLSGLGDKAVAEKLSIGYSTVRTHIDRAKFRLGCTNTLQLLFRAKKLLKPIREKL